MPERHMGKGGVAPLFHNLGVRCSEWSASCHGHITSEVKLPKTFSEWEIGWTPEPVWMLWRKHLSPHQQSNDSLYDQTTTHISLSYC